MVDCTVIQVVVSSDLGATPGISQEGFTNVTILFVFGLLLMISDASRQDRLLVDKTMVLLPN